MQLIDLTQTIAPDMPVYPGTEAPIFRTSCWLERDGFREQQITFSTHTGTHVDAPAHLLKNGKTLDQMPMTAFAGSALRMDFSGETAARIEIRHLAPYQSELIRADFFLIQTGWSRYWGEEKYFTDFPVLSPAAARWLAGFRLKGIGVDAISVDPADSVDLCIHKILLDSEILLIENLVNLEQIPVGQFDFFCMPLKTIAAEGAPVRAGAMIVDETFP